MWIAHTEGWLSIVKHRDRDGMLLVRARDPIHITSLWPDADVFYLGDADYHHRAIISAEHVGKVISNELQNIPYDNFKRNVTEPRLSAVFSRIWELIFRYIHD